MKPDAPTANTLSPENSAAFFVRALVHELRGDVEGLRGLVALLSAALLGLGTPPADPATICAFLERTMDLLRERLDQILILSRENSLPLAQRQLFAVRGVLEAALAAVERPDVSISIDCPDDLVLCGEPVYLTLALQTALRNAIAAVARSPVDRSIQIICGRRQQDSWTIITIADSGPGFTPELLRASVTHRAPDGWLLADWSGQPGEHGIGLLLIDWVASMHGGQVQIGNRARGGAEVRIELPG